MGALLARFAGGAHAFETPSRIACFGLVALLSGTLVAATVGVSALCFFGHAPWSGFPALWATWWLGDSAGALGLAPVIVLWAQSLRDAHGAGTPGPVFPRAAGIVFLSAAVVGLLAFSPLFEHSFIRVPLAFLAIVPLFAAALPSRPARHRDRRADSVEFRGLGHGQRQRAVSFRPTSTIPSCCC